MILYGDTEIVFSSDSDHEKIMAEIYYKSKFVASLNQDNGLDNLVIEFPGDNIKDRDAIANSMPLELLEKAISLAKEELAKTG